MVTGTVRNIVKIDEDRCTGCGECIISCAEGALAIIDGKARLVSEKYCDGLGNCLGCPEGAISIEERPADEFDEAAVEAHLKAEGNTGFSYPAETVTEFAGRTKTPSPTVETPAPALRSRLGHWPVQLTLVPPTAPFLKDSDVVLAADCVPFACADFHRDFLADHALLVACPKLDDFPAHLEKLTVLLRQSGLKSLTVVHMEVPCCSGLVHLARQAILASGNVLPFRDVTISIQGERKAG